MKLSTITLSVLLVAAVAYAGYLQTELNRLKSVPEESPSVAVVESQEKILEEVVEVSAEPVPAVETVAVENEAPPPPENNRQSRRVERMKQMMAAFDDPEMRVDMIERQMNRVDSRYADFFKKLNISAEDLDTLRTLMAEQGVVGWETRMRTFGAESDEARAQAQIARDLQREVLEEQITALLGEEGANALQDYSETLPYRNEVESLASSLSFTDTPLSETQSEALVSKIRDVSKSFEYTVDLSQMRGRAMANVAPEDVSTFFEERATRDDLILQAAAEALDDSQLAAYAERQLAERERDRRQLEFMQQNPGGFGRGGSGGGGRP